MKQTRLLLLAGFGGLLLLMALLGSGAVSFLRQVQIRQERLRQDYVERDRTLEQLRAAVYLTGTYVRDYLLDRTDPPSPLHEAQYRNAVREVEAAMKDAATLLPGPELEDVRAGLNQYLEGTGEVFVWTAAERSARAYDFTEKRLLPKRVEILALTDQLRKVSDRQLETGRQSVSALLSSFLLRLTTLCLLALALGLALAVVTLRRILRLETDSAVRLDEATRAREALARLSADLVAAQENERRRISHELHDEVGQTLYATVLGLGNLRASLADNRPDDAARELQLVNELTERTAGVVRNMALLLRPAILDDLGLLPALKWLAREATRTQSIPVDVDSPENALELNEDQVTCVYRIVQESIHNAQKHSHGRAIHVDLRRDGATLTVRIADDGRGFDAAGESGIGILGMRERAHRLGGSVAIESAPGRGTAVVLRLPVTA